MLLTADKVQTNPHYTPHSNMVLKEINYSAENDLTLNKIKI